jgi:group I intron endonuclease
MSKICGIYSILNKLNNKTYIGSSCDIERRWRHHRQNLNKGIHHCIHLQRAWNKYGEKHFIFNIEQQCKRNKLISIEQSYLNQAKANPKNIIMQLIMLVVKSPKL